MSLSKSIPCSHSGHGVGVNVGLILCWRTWTDGKIHWPALSSDWFVQLQRVGVQSILAQHLIQNIPGLPAFVACPLGCTPVGITANKNKVTCIVWSDSPPNLGCLPFTSHHRLELFQALAHPWHFLTKRSRMHSYVFTLWPPQGAGAF